MKPFQWPSSYEDLVRLLIEEDERQRAVTEMRKFEAELILGRKLKPHEQYERVLKRV